MIFVCLCEWELKAVNKVWPVGIEWSLGMIAAAAAASIFSPTCIEAQSWYDGKVDT